MNYPDVTIVIMTYNRADLVRKCIKGLMRNLQYPRDKLHWLVSDDATGGDYCQKLEKEFKRYNLKAISTPLPKQSADWGKSANNALAHIETDYMLFVEDDWLLRKKLNLRHWIAAMEIEQAIGFVRLSGVVGHNLSFTQGEIDTTAYDFGMIKPYDIIDNKLNCLIIQPQSGGLYCYSNRPHLKHKRFHEFYGNYTEGLMLGHCEESFAHQVKDRLADDNAPRLVVPSYLMHNPFELMTVESWQNSDVDKGTL